MGAPLKLQVLPEFDEVQIPPPSTTDTMLKPFLEQAMDTQLLLGASLRFQLLPELVE